MSQRPATTRDVVDGVNVVLREDGTRIHLDDIATAAAGQEILDELDAAIDQIENQLTAARDGLSPNGPDWRRRAEIALKRKRRLRPRLQQRIGDLRRAGRQAEVQAVAAAGLGAGQRHAFILAAAEMLDHELITEIWARARELRPAAFPENGR